MSKKTLYTSYSIFCALILISIIYISFQKYKMYKFSIQESIEEAYNEGYTQYQIDFNLPKQNLCGIEIKTVNPKLKSKSIR